MLAADEIGVLALPAEPRRSGKRLFHDRRGVGENLDADLAKPALRPFRHQPSREHFQRLLDHIVIVRALSIGRNPRKFRMRLQGERIVRRRIAHAQANHAPCLGPKVLRRLPVRKTVRHPVHLPVHSGIEPRAQVPGSRSVGRRRSHAERHEASYLCLAREICHQLVGYCRVNQTCGCSCSHAKVNRSYP